MISKEKWDDISKTIEKALGKGSIKYIPSQDCAFIYSNKKAIAMIRSDKDGPALVHFLLSLRPSMSAYIACLIISHIDFSIAEHFEVDERGKFLNEDEAIEYLSKKIHVFDKESEKLALEEAREDISIIKDMRKKDLLN